MIEYINSHQPAFWMTLGIALLAIEVLVMGLTTMVLIFAGLGAVVTGLLMVAGIVPESWTAGLAGFGISSGLVSVLLWKPLKNMQEGSGSKKKITGDFNGLEFVLEQDVSMVNPGSYRYSGIDWRLEVDSSSSQESIAAGQRVKVVAVEVGVFRIVALG